MLILPAIDIKDGNCVRLYKGDYSTAHKVAEDAVETAKAFEEAGYKYKILTHENMYPRHTAVIEEKGTKPGCYDVFEDDEWEDFNKIYESYRKKGYFLWQTFNRGVIITDDLSKIGKKDV